MSGMFRRVGSGPVASSRENYSIERNEKKGQKAIGSRCWKVMAVGLGALATVGVIYLSICNFDKNNLCILRDDALSKLNDIHSLFA